MSDALPVVTRPKDLGSPDPSRRRIAAEEPARGAERAASSLVTVLRDVSARVKSSLPEDLVHIRRWDREKMLREGKELSRSVYRQVFNRIPGVSAVAALVVGGWVASTFTTSPFKAALARWGLVNGGSRVVSGPMYRFLSVVLPILVAAVTAYVVQKIMKDRRERQMQKDIIEVSKLGMEVQTLVNDKLVILESARAAGLLSPNEYLAKKASLYAAHSRALRPEIRDLLISKLD